MDDDVKIRLRKVINHATAARRYAVQRPSSSLSASVVKDRPVKDMQAAMTGLNKLAEQMGVKEPPSKESTSTTWNGTGVTVFAPDDISN